MEKSTLFLIVKDKSGLKEEDTTPWPLPIFSIEEFVHIKFQVKMCLLHYMLFGSKVLPLDWYILGRKKEKEKENMGRKESAATIHNC